MTPASDDDTGKPPSRGAKAKPIASSELWTAVVPTEKPKDTPRHPPEYLALLKERDWKDLTRRLVFWIHRRTYTGSIHDAEDLAQSTFVALLEPSRRRWDPNVEPDFFLFLCSTAMSVIANWRRSRRRRPARAYDHDGLEDLEEMGAVAFSAPTTEEQYAARQRAAIAIERVEARIRDDVGCREILTLINEGVEEREAQMEVLEKDLAYVKNARRRLANHLAVVLAEIDAEELNGQH